METGEVQVFVDDYVIGRLPAVCAVTGEPSTDQVRFRTNVSPLNPIWILLIFLGPIGWIALAFMSASRRSYLTGWLPYAHEIAKRHREQRRLVVIATSVAVVSGFVLAALMGSGLLVGFAFAALVVGLVVLMVLERGEPRVALDGSGRWVTLGNVHPAFVAAVTTRLAGDQHSQVRS